MKNTGGKYLAVILLLMLALALSCGDDNDNPQTDGDTDGDSGDTTWQVSVTLSAGGSDTVVDLSTLDRTTYNDQDAVRLTRVIETLALATPWNQNYNFVGNDGFSILTDKLDGDQGGLPCYGELEHGFLYWETDDENNTYLRIGWDDSVAFPKFMKAKGMDGGTIQVLPIADTTINVYAGDIRTAVDVTALTTTDVIDYKHPEDGAKAMVPLTAVFEAAGVTDASSYSYRIFGNDGFSNGDDNLMPWENVTHTYMVPGTRAIVSEEAWDTEECCWRVKDVIVLQGVAPATAE